MISGEKPHFVQHLDGLQSDVDVLGDGKELKKPRAVHWTTWRLFFA